MANEDIKKASAPGAFEGEYGNLDDGSFVPYEQPGTESHVVPFGLDKTGRVSCNAGQEGAQAVHEQRTHHTGRIIAADDAPNYAGSYNIRGRDDET